MALPVIDTVLIAEITNALGDIIKTLPEVTSTTSGKAEPSEIMIGAGLTVYIVKMVVDWLKGDTLVDIKNLLKDIFKENGNIKANQVSLHNTVSNINATTMRNHDRLGKVQSNVDMISVESTKDAMYTNDLAKETRESFKDINDKLADVNLKLATK